MNTDELTRRLAHEFAVILSPHSTLHEFTSAIRGASLLIDVMTYDAKTLDEVDAIIKAARIEAEGGL